MSILEPYYDLINPYFSKWIKVEDKFSNWTIEDFPYSEGVNEIATNPHCWRCVTVNKCWFKNETNKKPEHFDYSKYSYNEIPKSDRGLYHPHCHCKELAINVPKENDIDVILTSDKINNFFKNKSGLSHSWGYRDKDKNEFIELLKSNIKISYRRGNYYKEKHTRFGYQINLLIIIEGVNEKKGKEYQFESAFIIFPNGKIRCVTIFGGF